MVLGVCGVGVVFSNQLAIAGRQALAGCVALFLSSIFAAYSNVLVKAYGKNLEPAILAAGQMFFGLLLCCCSWHSARRESIAVSLDADGSGIACFIWRWSVP